MAGQVAIIGIGCRFPGGVTDPQGFWELLESGIDPIGPIPEGRFDVKRFLHPEPGTPGKLVTADGGFLPDIDQFDAGFFGLSPREARKIDPQHRLLLEVAYEALEDAGIPVSSLAGRRVGVYVGIWTGEYENVMYRSPAELDFHSITGGGRYAASGRISYAFDLRGPALTVDTGCSASLVALHLARQAIETGEADLAIVGAANLVLQPHVNIGYSRSGMLSAGGRCRFGDDDAAGYVRSDGAAAIVLKPLDNARADRDPIRGVLLATGVNADGRGSGQLATPSSDAQAELLETVYDRAGVDPSTVPYVEAHGTGTRAGDPVELSALGRVLGKDRRTPLIVGSVKTNIGHTEACAGMAGLIKTLLALEHRRIPANLHLRTPNATIAWGDLKVEIPTIARDWPADAPLVAGVSSFGITGTNAHAVVAAPESVQSRIQPGSADMDTHVFAVSGATATARDQAAERLREFLRAHPELDAGDVAYTTTARREHHMHRLTVIAADANEAAAALDAHLAGEASPAVAIGEVTGEPRVAFVFSGQGSQWVGMTRELTGRARVFTETLERLDALVQAQAGWSVRDVLLDDSGQRLERVEVIQPTLTCVQIALAEQLRAWGVIPQAVVGHSMGEVAAAYVAGALSMEDAVRVIVTRSRLLARIAGHGAMALLDLDERETLERIAGIADRVSVAALNGPRSTVISGDPAAIDDLLVQLDDEGIFCRRVKVDVASHSAQTDPLLADLAAELSVLTPQQPSIPFYSTPRPDAPVDALLDAAYWVDNLRHAVRLNTAVQRMIGDGIDTFVEIAPHPVLLSSLGDIAADADAAVRTYAGPRRDEPELRRLLDLVARLHVSGVAVAWERIARPDANVVRLPSYPWQRERHWIEGWEDWSGTTGDISVPKPDQLHETTYRIAWEAAPSSRPPERAGAWLVIGGPDPLTRSLIGQMRASDRRVLEASTAGDIASLVHDAGAIVGIIDLRAVGDVRGSVSFRDAAERVLDIASESIDYVVATRLHPAAGTWFVTAGAQSPASRAAGVDDAPQAALWGYVRTAGFENPTLRLSLLDLDPSDLRDPATAAQQLWSAIQGAGDETQLALVNGEAYRPRMVRADTDVIRTAASWRPDGAYLITGGLGDLGLKVAEAMVQHGARRLILAGRSLVPARDRWSEIPAEDPLHEKLEAVLRLEQMGAAVHIASIDVGDAQQLAAFLERYRAERWPAIRGVIHCAGVMRTGVSGHEAFASMVHGKAVGAYNLHTLLPELDHFVLFSSIASVFPQANGYYAAANAVLDAVAAARRASGQHAVSISWDAWTNSGLTRNADVARYLRILEGRGIRGFEPERAVQLFPWLAGANAAHVVAANVEWSAATSGFAAADPFYSELVVRDARSAAGGRAAILALPEAQRRGAMTDRVRSLVAEVLQLSPATISPVIPFGKQGLDSLMAVEFRNRLELELGLRLPASLTWNYPTLGVLAEHLLSLISESPTAPAATADNGAAAPAEPQREDIAQLVSAIAAESDEDVLRMLRGGAV